MNTGSSLVVHRLFKISHVGL